MPDPAVRLRPMADSEVSGFLVASIEHYVAERVAAGDSPEAARTIAGEAHADYFPEGRPAPGHEVLLVERDGVRVGVLWLGPRLHRENDLSAAWVYDIEIDEAARGQGLGRVALALAEEHVAARGVTELGLNVFGPNTVARNLYLSSGYVERAIRMSKQLPPNNDTAAR